MLLLFCTVAAHAAKPKRPQHSVAKATKRPSAGKASARGSRASGTSAARAGSKARPVARGKGGSRSRTRSSYIPHATVNPMARLDTISELSSSLAHGTTALTYPNALKSFYEALVSHQAEPSAAALRVLQFGDSHTAADMFTGEARRVFQGQFGNGGVGFSYAGHPFAGYRIYGSQRSQSGGWMTLGTHFTDLGDAKTGLGGVAVSTYSPGQTVTLDASCTTFEMQYLRQPGGGTVQISDNGLVVGEVSTATENSVGDTATAPGMAASDGGSFTYDCPSTSPLDEHHFVLTTETHAPVRLLGTTTLQPGVTWEAMGINGAQAPLMQQWNQPLFLGYLSRTSASLVVLAYGTNEAAAPHWTYEAYSEVFARLIDTIHAALPGASVLVLGPADRSTAARRRGFAPFAGTEHIVSAQKDVCRAHGCAFWDTQRRMGGFGAMQRWVYAGWAQSDHTHLNGEGYRVLADALMADILSGYDNYRAAHGLSVAPSLRSTPPARAPADSPKSQLPPTPSTNLPQE